MREKIESYLGFAKKAGKLAVGTDTCIRLMEKRKIKLLIIASDLAVNSRKKILIKAENNKVPYRVFSTKEELSIITGERLSGVFGITDENFAASILGELAKKEER